VVNACDPSQLAFTAGTGPADGLPPDVIVTIGSWRMIIRIVRTSGLQRADSAAYQNVFGEKNRRLSKLGGGSIRTRSRLLRNFQRIIDLNAEVANGAFELGMAEQKLHGGQILRAFIDQCGLSAPHGALPIYGRAQSCGCHPLVGNLSELTHRDMLRCSEPAVKQVSVWRKMFAFYPRGHRQTGRLSQSKLYRSLRVALNNHGALGSSAYGRGCAFAEDECG
jgi:hypothetical protein